MNHTPPAGIFQSRKFDAFLICVAVRPLLFGGAAPVPTVKALACVVTFLSQTLLWMAPKL